MGMACYVWIGLKATVVTGEQNVTPYFSETIFNIIFSYSSFSLWDILIYIHISTLQCVLSVRPTHASLRNIRWVGDVTYKVYLYVLFCVLKNRMIDFFMSWFSSHKKGSNRDLLTHLILLNPVLHSVFTQIAVLLDSSSQTVCREPLMGLCFHQLLRVVCFLLGNNSCVVLCVVLNCCVLYILFWIVLFYVLFLSIVLFYVLSVCKCVLYYCHRVSTQLQLNISYINSPTSEFYMPTFRNTLSAPSS